MLKIGTRRTLNGPPDDDADSDKENAPPPPSTPAPVVEWYPKHMIETPRMAGRFRNRFLPSRALGFRRARAPSPGSPPIGPPPLRLNRQLRRRRRQRTCPLCNEQ
ncbi:hypothetical protein GPALN_004540 [Globodera pallida]|nr:hypothetical protein GPALN_004540 [Globodera pallida]